MIVDDQADIRDLIRLLIELADDDLVVGCEASSGREALALLDACDPTVVVLDEMMPGMNGIEVATRIAERRPGQRVIMCSAYLDDDVTHRARLAGVAAFVHKDEIRRIPDLIRELGAA
jgi:DNA-binding NarL/FixJ family response regulator